MDSSDWVRKIVLERELADIESKFVKTITAHRILDKEGQTYEKAKKDSEEFMKNCHVCEYIREQLGEMS